MKIWQVKEPILQIIICRTNAVRKSSIRTIAAIASSTKKKDCWTFDQLHTNGCAILKNNKKKICQCDTRSIVIECGSIGLIKVYLYALTHFFPNKTLKNNVHSKVINVEINALHRHNISWPVNIQYRQICRLWTISKPQQHRVAARPAHPLQIAVGHATGVFVPSNGFQFYLLWPWLAGHTMPMSSNCVFVSRFLHHRWPFYFLLAYQLVSNMN